ncbi:unnamed protein product, partial [marine sediment metagenome]
IGPGFGCISSIQKLKYGISWEKAASNSGGNGTAMRVSPIGLFYCKDIKNLEKSALKSSIITHSHPAASAGAIVIARAIAFLIDKKPETVFSIDEFFETIILSISNSQERIWEEFIVILNKVKQNLNISIKAGLIKFSQVGVKSPYFIEEYLGKAFVHPYTLSTVACAIFVFLKNLNSFEDCIFQLATAGGDSDTVGAIGGSLAGAYFGCLVVVPYYNKPVQHSLIDHFSAIADSISLPIILYNVPSRTGRNLEPETVSKLAYSKDNIVGIKCASGNIDQITKFVKTTPEDFIV